MNLFTKRKQTYRLKDELVVASEEGWEGGIVRELGKVMYTPLYLKQIIHKDLLYSTGNSAQCYVAAQMGSKFGREWIHVYVWLSPFADHLKGTGNPLQ